MHRIDAEGAVADANGPGRAGFADNYPLRTKLGAKWANAVQEELARLVEIAGGTLDDEDNEQVAWAIATLIVTGVAPKVTGPASATDRAIPRYSGTSGKVVLDSGVTLEDDNDIAGVKDLTLSGDVKLAAPKPLTSYVSASEFKLSVDANGVCQWSRLGSDLVTTRVANAKAFLRLNNYVPAGATITRIRLVRDAATSSSSMAYSIEERELAVFAAPTVVATYGPYTGGPLGATVVEQNTPTIALFVDPSRWLDWVFTSSGSVGDAILALAIEYTITKL